MKQVKRNLTSLLSIVLLCGCGASIRQVAATDSENDTYQFCVKVVQPLAPLGLQAKIMGCATTESAAQEQRAQLQTLYPRATMRVVMVRK